MKRSTGSTVGARWMAPIEASLQACSPRLRRSRRVVEVSVVLLSLMQDLQQHRGLSGALLDQQLTFRGERAAVAEKLQRSLRAVAEQFGERHAVFRSDSWRGLLARWEALSNNWPNLDFSTNLSAHSELVLAVVDILGEIARDNAESLGVRRTRVASEWPALAEHLGMLRAIGLHLIGAAHGMDDARLCGAFKHHLHEFRSLLASIAADGYTPDALLQRSELVVARVVALRDGATKIGAQAYHDQMTRNIDDWFAAIRSQLSSS